MTKMNLQPEKQAPSASLITYWYTANLLHKGKETNISKNYQLEKLELNSWINHCNIVLIISQLEL